MAIWRYFRRRRARKAAAAQIAWGLSYIKSRYGQADHGHAFHWFD